MGSIALSLLVLRTANMEAMLAFYRAVGLAFVQEQHGSGPVHYSSEIGELVIEIYPAEEGHAPDRKQGGATMPGFSVTDLDGALSNLRQLGIEPLSAPKESAWGRRAVVLDPDGRAVELSQKIEPDRI